MKGWWSKCHFADAVIMREIHVQ